jgi:radical SAM protein with 4Fe4S-binding SPASM domain
MDMEFECRELQIEPTNRCNLHCSICSHALFGVSKQKDLTFPEFKTILDKFNNNVKRIFLQGLGEPFLNPKLNEMISYACGRGLFIYTTTNANALTEKIIQGMILAGLNELRISIDTFDSTLYENIKSGGKLKRVIDAIKLINQKKKEHGVSYPVLRLNTVLMKETISGLAQVIEMAALLGIVEVSLIPLVVHGNGLATEEHNVSVLSIDELGSLILQAKHRAKEHGIELVSGISTERHPDAMAIEQFVIPKCYHSMYVQSNGDLSPCCNMPLNFGNIFKEGLTDILNGEKIRTLRNFIQQNKPSCHDCVNFAYNCIN